MKEAEYSSALKADDQPKMDLVSAALTLLKEELTNAVKAFDALPIDSPDPQPKSPKKTGRWQNFYNIIKVTTNKK